MGHKGLKDEKKRQVGQRRAQAKNAMRRYCDEIQFVMGKDSRDTVRRVQRQLRDHYTVLAEELNRSNAAALTAATDTAKRTQAEREKRLRTSTPSSPGSSSCASAPAKLARRSPRQ